MTDKLAGHFSQLAPDGTTETTISFQIQWTVEDGLITGTCTDQQFSRLTSEPASITGFIEDNFISFVKSYPIAWRLDENRIPRLDLDSRPHEVHYSGYMQDGHFEGEWEISFTWFDEHGEPYEYYDSGPWQMDKV
jgi:hypothetical protein